MSLRSAIVGQFRQPHGLLGHVAGLVMANRPSNRKRNEWTLSLLALEAGHRVLEIGCGPGVALNACAARTSEGHVVGIDHSQVMVRQARERLAAAIASGRADVRLGSLSDLDNEHDAYDRIFSSNVVQFFPNMDDAFSRIHGFLADGGVAATTYQPRSKSPTRENALGMAARIENAMKAAGFGRIERHELLLKPVPVICVIGVKT
jgi:cyclopropane fatty-acyl-phospholipid synthase-like methyltransferase